MKVAVLTDVHANLPALEAALGVVFREGCDLLVSLGDVIGIGPYPLECLELLLQVPNIRFVVGNHDEWFAYGLPRPQPEWMGDGEFAHQRWTHEQLDSALKVVVAQWPYMIEETFGGVLATFAHYGRGKERRGFAEVVRPPMGKHLAHIFDGVRGDLFFYGHDHIVSDMMVGQLRFVNPGALGCGKEAVARFLTAVFPPTPSSNQPVRITPHAVPYDDTPLYRAFEQRRVPDRQFIYRVFYGSRFS